MSADARDQPLHPDVKPARQPDDRPQAWLASGPLEPRDLSRMETGATREVLLRQPGGRTQLPDVGGEPLRGGHTSMVERVSQ